MRKFMMVVLVLTLASFGAWGCADGKKNGGGTPAATPPSEKLMDVETKIKSGPTEVTFLFADSQFVKDTTITAKIVSWEAEQDGNTTSRTKLEVVGGKRKLVLTATDADHETRLVAIGADGKIVTDAANNEVVADFSAWPQVEGSFAVDIGRGAFRWFLFKGRVVPSPVKATVVKKTGAGYEQTISVLAELFPVVRNPGTGKWNWEINKLATQRSEATDAKDGWRSVTVALSQQENSSLRAVFVDGGNVIQQDNKDLVTDFTTWSSYSYPVNVTDGTILLRADRGDLTKWGTREVPGRPGTDGYGPNRFGTELVNNVPVFHAYVQLPVLTDQEKKDGKRILFGADWDKFPARVNPVPWFPGWYEPSGVLGKAKWDAALEYEVVVADSTGTRERTFEWPEESEYLRPGSRSSIQFVVSGKALVAPVWILEQGAALAEVDYGQYPFVGLRMPGLGTGKTHFRVLGKFTSPKGEFRADVSLHPDLTWTEITRDAQGNVVPVPAGQEKVTVTRTNVDLTGESKPTVGLASGEVQGKVTFPPPVAPATQQVPPLMKERTYWVVP
ncbi:hypothetical protein HY624_01790 [Candidatus Uhrbacteria bacterium]|nr:hypothetical protein [Candidatus Uhrbacteria bacterium]